jgi:TPR repeat protein
MALERLVFYSSLPCGRAKQIVPALFSKILWDACEVEAVKWYHKSAEQGDVLAQRMLAGHYLRGKGVTEDKNQYRKWWCKANEDGSADDQLHVCV